MSLDYMMSNSQNQEKNAQWLFHACVRAGQTEQLSDNKTI